MGVPKPGCTLDAPGPHAQASKSESLEGKASLPQVLTASQVISVRGWSQSTD